MLKIDLNEIEFLLASMEKVQIPASASPQIADLIAKIHKEKASLIKKDASKDIDLKQQ